MRANELMSHMVPLFRAIMLAGYDYKFDLVHPEQSEGIMVYRLGNHQISQMSLALNKCFINAPDFGMTAYSSDNPWYVIETLTDRFEWLQQPSRPALKYHEERPVLALFHTRDIGVVRLDTPKWS